MFFIYLSHILRYETNCFIGKRIKWSFKPYTKEHVRLIQGNCSEVSIGGSNFKSVSLNFVQCYFDIVLANIFKQNMFGI